MTTKIKTSAEYGSEIKMPHVPKDLTADIVAEAYRRIAANPVVVSGTIGNTSAGDSDFSQNIQTVWSQRDIDRKEKTRFTKTITLQVVKGTEGDVAYKCTSCTRPQEISNLLWDVESPSERKRAVVVKQKDKKGEEKQFVEIWDLRHKVKTIDVKALEKHGDIVGNDGQFGNLRWSPCEEYLLYIAEKKKPKTTSFFDAKSSVEKDKGDNADDVAVKGEEYLHLESWGEQLVERHHTVICRLHISSSTVTVLTSVPDDCSPGQVLWGPDSEVVFVGWCHEPYRLGLKFCVERKSFLFKASFDGTNCEKLSEEGRAVRCPSFSPDFSRLVYLDTPEGGAHNQCSRLMMIDWKKLPAIQEARTVVVDIVNSPYESGYDPEREEFPGLYTWADLGSLRNWLKDNVHLLLTSYCRSASTVVLINTDTKTVRRLYPGDHKCSCTLLDVRGHDALVACSWPNQPPVLMLGCLKPDKLEASRWVQLGSDQDNPPTNTCFDWELHVHHPKTLQSTHPSYLDPKTLQSVHPDYDYLSFDSILFLPAKDGDTDSKPPLVLFPHGGPHSTFDTGFQLNPAVFACCGFAVLCVNFRGSLGFGQDSINSLLGHIGDFDVKDCLLAMERVRKENLVDRKNTFVYGGSHGGFLAAHLIGQYPKEFKAASMRNPVINLTSMVGTSDIRDWIFTEAGLQFDYKSLADGDLLPRLWKASPINYIDSVKTPVMLNIGLKDLRVPPSQGLEYYKMLKARGVPVRCLTYPDSNHSLSEVEVEADSLINSILWFAQHISDEDISQD